MNSELVPHQPQDSSPAVADPAAEAALEWLPQAFDATVRWLVTTYESDKTRNAYAGDLGVPRELQTWRPTPTSNRGRRSPGPAPQSFFRWCAAVAGINPFTELDEERAKAWIRDSRKLGDSDLTLRRRVGALGAWYAAMRRKELTTLHLGDLLTQQDRKNLHIVGKKPKKKTVAAKMKQVRALQVAAAMDPSELRERNMLIVELLCAGGLRSEEICDLDLDDLHEDGPASVPAFWVEGKGSKRRWSFLSAIGLDMVHAYIATRIPPEGKDSRLARPEEAGRPDRRPEPFITSINGRRLTPAAITAVVRRLCRLLDPDSENRVIREAARTLAAIANTATPHQFRHFQARESQANGATITQTRIGLGHASIATTQAYLEDDEDAEHATSVLVSDLMHAGQDLAQLQPEFAVRSDEEKSNAGQEGATHEDADHSGASP